MQRVFVDTSVLFPFSVMDLFLALSENAVHEVLWTDELLEEWERVIVREQRRSLDSATSVTTAIREFFADSRIDPTTYRQRVAAMPGPDADDRVHSAAALTAGASALITWDEPGFPVDDLAALGLRVVDPDTYLVDPDTYLTELHHAHPAEVHSTIIELARTKTRPPMSTDDVLDALERAGLSELPRRLRSS